MTEPLYLVAGARPNFIKLAPLVWALQKHGGLPFRIVHTGQHYDYAMSQAFFDVLGIPEPDFNLDVGSGEQNIQTARILERFDELLQAGLPRAVVVFGDVNSTLACSLAAAKRLVPVVHVEAGLRSFDRTMPEEINRLVTDVLADLLLASEKSGVDHLTREGVPPEKIRLVGNIMIDTLLCLLPAALKRQTPQRLGMTPGSYAMLTLHRPANVDDPQTLQRLLGLFAEISQTLPVIFPVHPRTRKQMQSIGFEPPASFRLIEPADYLDSLCLQHEARLVLTDSGGMQEETSQMGIPCLTLRPCTERPVTVGLGTSTLVGNDPVRIRAAFDQVMSGQYKRGGPIPLWDGHTAERVVGELERQGYR